MSCLLFVLNDLSEFDFAHLLDKHLSSWRTEVATEMPADCSAYKLIVLWSYRKIIKNIPEPNNVVVFHSSDLPERKGWAPIYYTIAEDSPYYVISGILAAPQVDAGDIVLKARFSMLPNYTATALRCFDHEASIIGARKILERFRDRPIVGVPQRGPSTYRQRRSPEDNRIDVNRRFGELVPHLRACEPLAPAFFEYRGSKYTITIAPKDPPRFPADIEFIFAERES